MLQLFDTVEERLVGLADYLRQHLFQFAHRNSRALAHAALGFELLFFVVHHGLENREGEQDRDREDQDEFEEFHGLRRRVETWRPDVAVTNAWSVGLRPVDGAAANWRPFSIRGRR